jgi:hypothetical protein
MRVLEQCGQQLAVCGTDHVLPSTVIGDGTVPRGGRVQKRAIMMKPMVYGTTPTISRTSIAGEAGPNAKIARPPVV